MKKKCKHNVLIKIIHWWFRLKCKDCNKRFRIIPKKDYYFYEQINFILVIHSCQKLKNKYKTDIMKYRIVYFTEFGSRETIKEEKELVGFIKKFDISKIEALPKL